MTEVSSNLVNSQSTEKALFIISSREVQPSLSAKLYYFLSLLHNHHSLYLEHMLKSSELAVDKLESSLSVLGSVTLVSRSIVTIRAVRIGCITIGLNSAGVGRTDLTSRPWVKLKKSFISNDAWDCARVQNLLHQRSKCPHCKERRECVLDRPSR